MKTGKMMKTGSCDKNIDYWQNFTKLNKWLSKDSWKIFMSKITCPEMQNLKLILKKCKDKIEILSTLMEICSVLMEICSRLLEFWLTFSVSVKKLQLPVLSTFLTHNNPDSRSKDASPPQSCQGITQMWIGWYSEAKPFLLQTESRAGNQVLCCLFSSAAMRTTSDMV